MCCSMCLKTVVMDVLVYTYCSKVLFGFWCGRVVLGTGCCQYFSNIAHI